MKLMFVSLGCDKNLVDTEIMLGILDRQSFEFTNDENEADVIVVNTCCFINDAKRESIDTILEMADYKEHGTLKVLVVTGCLAQRYKQEIIDEIPQVDVVLGTSNYNEIATAIQDALNGKKGVNIQDASLLPLVDGERIVTTGGHFAYLKIAEGCNKNCTYCIIPKIRGKYRSIPMEYLIKQAETLVRQGVKELILVAQETSMYGIDIYGEKRLPVLLRQLCKIKGLHWIRIMYCYPEEITDELIQVIKEEKKICHYLDLPIQHANDEILKRMGRKMNKQQLIGIIEKLRSEIPDICLRTTLITGFPGETKFQHEEMLSFIDEMEFDRLGVFTYSREEDTPAANMDNQVEDNIKDEWRNELMELQQEVSFDKAQALIGQKMTVMIEGKVSGENAYIARSYRDAPDVDGYVFITTDEELISGDFVNVIITGALEYDLIGEIYNEFAK